MRQTEPTQEELRAVRRLEMALSLKYGPNCFSVPAIEAVVVQWYRLEMESVRADYRRRGDTARRQLKRRREQEKERENAG